MIFTLLFAVFPFVFFLAQNPAELQAVDIIVPLSITLLATAIVLILMRVLLKNTVKAAAITSLCLLLFWSYGYVYDALIGVFIGGIEIGRARYLLLTYVIIFMTGAAFIIFTRRSLKMLQQFLNVVALALVLMSAVTVVPRLFNGTSRAPATAPVSETASDNIITNKPDIYYIILDGYANSHTLRDFYGYDNSSFLSYLKDKGFYVVDKSTSNFAVTQISLASSLNMEYVNYLADQAAGKDKDFDPTTELIENGKVWQFLRDQGYKYITFRSIWGATSSNPYADVQLQGGKFNELTMLIVNTTLLRASLLYPPVRSYILGDYRERILYTFAQLGAMPEFNKVVGPKFVFAHILSPHPPFIFGPNGESVPGAAFRLKPDDVGWSPEEKQYYINQIVFLNKKVETTVDQILAKSKIPPIIVIQSDHGSWSTAGEGRANNHLYRERMRNFNALYLPGGDAGQLYETMTPVNSFRVIFNKYFGADFPLLEDRNYFSDSVSDQKTPYQFVDVTDIVTQWEE